MDGQEPPVKDGILFQQQIKFGKKSWRRMWAHLYAGGPSGVARLESWDMREGGPPGGASERAAGPGRRGERRVIRLADCVSVQPAEAESCPRDTSAFMLSTTERSHLLAAQHRQEWLDAICHLAFPGTGECSPGSREDERPQRGLVCMEENSIYSSWQEVGEFAVVVQRTEAATRCQLKGNYVLRLDREGIHLSPPGGALVLYTWPFHYLRKFGSCKGVFSFEAGRRCDSGEGLFAFSSARAQELCGAVAAAIARQRELLPEWAGARPCPLPRATSLPSLDAPGELRELPPGPQPCAASAPYLAEPGPQSLPLLPAPPDEPPAGLYASVCKRAGGSDHLYENVQGEARGAAPGGRSSSPASPIYHNSEDLSWPGPGPDSSLEAQYRRLLELELTDGADGEAGPGPAGAHSGFKAKLVTLLSRERRKGPP
ncbi:docking protein 3 [Sorex fumeus]|uniref:docking protein 3 n=1 Tax=Sorex fumeus TaxID=62283 RepID=UPI0024ACC770|nr:docking protein 3 [Sorex fumeus]